MVEIPEVGLRNLEFVALVDLHTRETVTASKDKGRCLEHAIGRSRVYQQRCDWLGIFQTPKRPSIKSAGDGKSSAIFALYMRATSFAYSVGETRWQERARRAESWRIKSSGLHAGGSA